MGIVNVAVDIPSTGKLYGVKNSEHDKSGDQLPPVCEIDGKHGYAQITDYLVENKVLRVWIVPVFLRPWSEDVMKRRENHCTRKAPDADISGCHWRSKAKACHAKPVSAPKLPGTNGPRPRKKPLPRNTLIPSFMFMFKSRRQPKALSPQHAHAAEEPPKKDVQNIHHHRQYCNPKSFCFWMIPSHSQ